MGGERQLDRGAGELFLREVRQVRRRHVGEGCEKAYSRF